MKSFRIELGFLVLSVRPIVVGFRKEPGFDDDSRGHAFFKASSLALASPNNFKCTCPFCLSLNEFKNRTTTWRRTISNTNILPFCLKRTNGLWLSSLESERNLLKR